MLEAVRIALRITTNAYDDELQALIKAALCDIGLVGVDTEKLLGSPLVVQAVKTYVRMNFGSPSDYDRLKRSYDEQKAQMQTATGYGL
jgi:hypothetical protein